MQPATSAYLKGAVFGFAAVSIWASWSVITRGWPLRPASTRGTSWRCASAWRVSCCRRSSCSEDLARDRLGWLGLAVIISGTGAPYALVAAAGLRFAPAYDGGALNPGCMPLFVALIAALVLGEKLSTARKLGLSLILAGALLIVGWQAAAWSPSRTFGDALFLFAAFLTACFTVVMRQAELDPLHVAALVSTGSLVIYLPIYLAVCGTRLAQLPFAEITVQAIFQGVLVSIVSLLLYGRAVAILGASGGAAF